MTKTKSLGNVIKDGVSTQVVPIWLLVTRFDYTGAFIFLIDDYEKHGNIVDKKWRLLLFVRKFVSRRQYCEICRYERLEEGRKKLTHTILVGNNT